MKLVTLIIVYLFLAPLTYVHGSSLESLQATALKNRPIIMRYNNNIDKAGKDLTIAQNALYPSIDLAYTVNSLDKAAAFEAEENSIFYGAVTINLFAGFKDRYNIRSTTLLQEIETHRLRGIKQQIMEQVALYYLNVYGRRANLKAQKDTYSTLRRVLEDGQKRNQVGLIDNNALLKFRVDLDFAGIRVRTAQAELDKSILLLRRESGSLVNLADLSFSEFQSIPRLSSYQSNEQVMLSSRSDIKALEHMLEVYQANEAMAKATYYPQLNFVSSYKNYTDDYVNGDNSVEEIRAQLVLSINLFNGFKSQETIAKARIDQHSVRLDLAELKGDLRAGLAALYLDYEVSRDNIGAALTNIEQAKENLRVTKLKYNEGMQTESELLGAVSMLSRADYNYVAVITSLYANYYKILRMVEKLADD